MNFKTRPEDFVVREIRQLKKQAMGKYLYFLLRKRRKTTPEVAELLAHKLGIPLKDIGYAGNKDKQAITEQYISLKGVSEKKVESLQLIDVCLTYVTHADERITLGDLEGNAFTVVVRNLQKKKKIAPFSVKNYFDEQRFGVSGINPVIGKALVRGDFRQACALLRLPILHNDYVGTLRTLHKKDLLFYIHSFQSFLWNKVVSHLVKPPKQVPLIGYLTELTGDAKNAYATLLEEEGVQQTDFLMPAMPELSSEGSERHVLAKAKNLTFTWEADELHAGTFKVTLTFTLEPGVYATQVVKQLLGKPL